MKLKLFQIIALLIIVSVLTVQSNIVQNFFNPPAAYAVGDLQVNWGAGVTPGDPIFVINNMAPGDSTNKTVTVTNNASSSKTTAIKGVPQDDADNLSTAMNITISDGSTTIYGPKTVKEFFTDSTSPNGIELTDVAAGDTKSFTFTVTFQDEAGNEFQGDTLVFDIIIGITFTIPEACNAIDLQGRFPIFGTDGNDRLNGTSRNDVIIAFEGNDRIDGGSGNDCIVAGAGNDRADGGSGSDIVIGNDGIDTIEGGSGKDVVIGNDGNDNLDGGSEDDNVSGDAGDDTMKGGSGNDTMSGGTGVDRMDGDSGNDIVLGNEDNDILTGSAGNDTLNGNTGTDSAKGDSGTDTCIAETKASCEL